MDFCLWQGIPQVYNDISQGHLSITTSIHMPLVYVVSPNGRTGAELRVARGTHELKATGQCARLGALLPNYSTTTTVGPNGAPLEVRLPYELAAWLALGLLSTNGEVGEFLVHMYIVGAERLGAALDMVLALSLIHI